MNENRIQSENSTSEGSVVKRNSHGKSGLIVAGVICFLIIIATIITKSISSVKDGIFSPSFCTVSS